MEGESRRHCHNCIGEAEDLSIGPVQDERAGEVAAAFDGCDAWDDFLSRTYGSVDELADIGGVSAAQPFLLV